MTILTLSRSTTFDGHLRTVLDTRHRAQVLRGTRLLPGPTDMRRIVLVHAPSFRADLDAVLGELLARADLTVGVAADAPDIVQMLDVTRHGVSAYFNSLMADVHYAQMLRMLRAGQTWFSPGLLADVLEIARRSVLADDDGNGDGDDLGRLTPREREIALDVARGLSNAGIAASRGIAERTVKAHLTRIFKKLEVKSRFALALRLRAPATTGVIAARA